MNKAKIILFFLLICFVNTTGAYTASEHIEINFNTTNAWNSVYTIPEGKDLVIYRLYSRFIDSNLKLRDSSNVNKVDGDFTSELYDINITFTDEVRAKGVPGSKDFTLFGYLVDEDEDIENYISGDVNAWNKNIFTKEDIHYIYTIEMAFFILAMMWVFFTRTITGSKGPFKI